METPDAETIVFNLGVQQPLFLSAMAATYGPQIINARSSWSMKRRATSACLAAAQRRGAPRHWGLEARLVRAGTRGHPGAQPGLWRGWEGNLLRADHHPCGRRGRDHAPARRSWRRRHHGTLRRVDYEWIDELQENPALNVNLGDSTEVTFIDHDRGVDCWRLRRRARQCATPSVSGSLDRR